MKRAEEMDQSHPNCTEGHVCQEPSGRTCLGCDEPAGTIWGPYWCPEHDKERLAEHGIGHPDPMSLAWFDSIKPDHNLDVHDCDGCCTPWSLVVNE